VYPPFSGDKSSYPTQCTLWLVRQANENPVKSMGRPRPAITSAATVILVTYWQFIRDESFSMVGR
jgi:hypothetical protein